MAGDYFSLQDYLDTFQGLSPQAAALSDVPGGAGGLGSIASGAGGGLGGLGSILGPIGIAAALSAFLPDIIGMFGGGRSATGPGSATADIAGASSSSDPVLALLGMGAGALGGNTPVSSSSAGPTYGPYFDVARKLEDLLRWGPGGLTDARAQGLDATTLKNVMHDLGNPNKASGDTLRAVQDTYQSGSKYLTPENIQLLMGQMDPNEQGILKNILGRSGGGGGSSSSGGAGGGGGYSLPAPAILNQVLGGLALRGGGGFGFGWA